MAREAVDPEQTQAASYFAEDPNAPLPEAKDIVVDLAKDADPGGVGDGGRTPAPDDRALPDPREGIRRGDKKPLRERAPPTPPNDTPSPGPDDGIDELQRQLARERADKARAEQAAAAALARASMAEHRYGQAATGMIDSAIEAASRASDQASARYVAALDISDHKTAAAAQVEIADARHNLLRLQEQKQMLQDQEAQRKAQSTQQRQPPQGDNLSRISAELDRTGYRKSAEWLRQHPDMVSDQDAINRVDGAHGYVANVLKIPVESDRYFDEMERILIDGEAPRETRRSQREAPQRSAPVSRNAPSLRNGETRRTVHLTPEQRMHARDVLGMTDEEYALELADAQDKGKLLGARR